MGGRTTAATDYGTNSRTWPKLTPAASRALPSCAHPLQLLRAAGVDAVNVAGGLTAWARDVDPAFPRY
jgi:hypothetical protein